MPVTDVSKTLSVTEVCEIIAQYPFESNPHLPPAKAYLVLKLIRGSESKDMILIIVYRVNFDY